ncbi:hypothetical protein UlMin_034898 [Ulmus minor]
MMSSETRKLVDVANKNGPYFGLVIPNLFEMDPLLNSADYNSTGRRFRFGTIRGKKVILVMIGLNMINAVITTQLLLSHFDVEGAVHYGIAGNANPSLNIGDVTIPHYWLHCFGKEGSTPEEREHVFWVPVNPLFYHISQTVEDLKLEGCLNTTTCLTSRPKVVRVERGSSASISMYLDFIYNISPVDMESASVALVSCNSSNTCHSHFVVHPSMLSKSDWRIRDERVYYFI